MNRPWITGFFWGCLLIAVSPAAQAADPQVVHVFVALCDNASQGIVPVPAKIGDGDKPEDNLYWGCTDGLKSYFRASNLWVRQPAVSSPRPQVLERVVFKHKTRNIYLVADAWQGREIQACLQSFVSAAGGGFKEPPLKLQVAGATRAGEGESTKEIELPLAAEARWLAYIGHNGLMEFEVQWPQPPAASATKDAFVLCCIGQRYFSKLAAPLTLTTRQLMYPGAFILHDALEATFDGKPASEIKAAAARAYAKNQGISVKAASGVFAGKGE
ncbi:MAG TPA: hypothetical protein VK956_18975 [Verrucomicrobium sp.]|nr:hypothetical protein [Verrucomicrobium sp.]